MPVGRNWAKLLRAWNPQWVIGRVVGVRLEQVAKVKCVKMVLDPYIVKYFGKPRIFYVYDPEKKCTMGDVVLLKALPEPAPTTPHPSTHEISEFVHQVGRIYDPIRGQRCEGTTLLPPETHKLPQQATRGRPYSEIPPAEKSPYEKVLPESEYHRNKGLP
ncbi:28S ribosomal protein S17, mitochondrial-like [Branchiostoma floridae]|uniref:28S ribosomal protein S17, mitochondrial-like n=1 Tax=Branchiostoma floridae TaxID=7739 RepID=A0A9J7HKJ9_BRAFL|nr:28S ribosomal protein S17, mitochondrial-like [Branchiostoma floridae]